jgi:hypothetical protein
MATDQMGWEGAKVHMIREPEDLPVAIISVAE